MINPKWKTIEGFPHYEVSDTGLVRSYRRKPRTWWQPHDDRREKPLLMTPQVDARGYRRVILRDVDGKLWCRTIHRLVALAFIPNSDNLPDAAHNNGKAGDDRAANLRWSTHGDNQRQMREHGTMQDGEKSITCKLTPAQVHYIREAVATEPRGVQRRLAKELGMSTAQICRIAKGTRWAYLS